MPTKNTTITAEEFITLVSPIVAEINLLKEENKTLKNLVAAVRDHVEEALAQIDEVCEAE